MTDQLTLDFDPTTTAAQTAQQKARDAAFEQMRALSDELFASADGMEGMAAFAEKRRPSWQPPA